MTVPHFQFNNYSYHRLPNPHRKVLLFIQFVIVLDYVGYVSDTVTLDRIRRIVK